MITLKHVTKSFDNVTAVRDLSLEIPSGEIFGFIGPNGAGKSTTIRMLMDIYKPDEGRILIDDRAVGAVDKNRIGYLPEERGLYKKVKVSDFLHYLGALKGASREVVDQNIAYWLDRFGLSDWKDRKCQELSKGMSQKIQFIASVVHSPDILILDEPFSGLDPVSVEALTDSILDFCKEGRTVIFSTHIMDQAEKLCRSLVLINKGKTVVKGPIRRIKENYGLNMVQVEYDGDSSFIGGLSYVKSVHSTPRYLEVELHEGESSDKLLKEVSSRLSVSRFEKMSPSLHKIFINLVGPQNVDEEALT